MSRAAQHTDGPLWSVGVHLPLVGKDLRALRGLARSLHGVTTVVRPALNDVVDRSRRTSLLPSGGRLDLDAYGEVAGTLARADEGVDAARARLRAVQASRPHGWIRKPVASTLDLLDGASAVVHGSATAAHLAPTLLGGQGARDYLVVFENNAEVRATGGFPGAFAVLHVDDGAVTIARQGSAAELGEFAPPAGSMHADEVALFGRYPTSFWGDANLTPDFPRAADFLRAMYHRAYGGDVDGVLAIDTVTMSKLLSATGPVVLPDGTRVADDTVVPLLLHDVYQRFPTDAGQNRFYRQVTTAVLGRMLAGQVDPLLLIAQARSAIDQDRILLNLTDADEQRELGASRIAGRLPRVGGARPHIGLYLNDATQAKLGYFLRRTTTLTAISCTSSGRQTLEVGATLRSLVPDDVSGFAPRILGDTADGKRGRLLLVLLAYAPAGGEITSLSVDGVEQTVNHAEHDGLDVATTTVRLPPGATAQVVFRARTAAGQRSDAQLRTTPGLDFDSPYVTAPDLCFGAEQDQDR